MSTCHPLFHSESADWFAWGDGNRYFVIGQYATRRRLLRISEREETFYESQRKLRYLRRTFIKTCRSRELMTLYDIMRV